ncbi:UNVERIFIED_CONTAM: Bola1, partial [Trichonephila clavipes]
YSKQRLLTGRFEVKYLKLRFLLNTRVLSRLSGTVKNQALYSSQTAEEFVENVVKRKLENALQRHRLVNTALKEELKGPIHALSIDAYAPTEVEKIEKKESPPCLGGSKK